MLTKSIVVFLVILGVLFGVKYSVKDKVIDDKSADVVQDQKDINDTRVSEMGGDTLDLSNKGLAKAPSYIFNQTSIVGLDLSYNNLDGALQAEVRHLINLKVLDLSNNKFTGVPAEIGQLSKLEVLDLSNNLLTGLPNELGNLTNLKLLDLTGNNYSESDLSTIRERLPSSTVIKTN